MEKKEINRSFINETFIKKYTSFMNHSAELFEYFSTLVEQKQKENTFNYENIYQKLSLYKNKISSLNTELLLLKKENIFLQEKLQMNQVNLKDNKEIASNKEDTQELKKLMSIIKGEVHDIRNTLLWNLSHSDEHELLSKGDIQKICGQPSLIQGIQHDVHVEKIHTNGVWFIMELKDKRIATCGYDKAISVVSINYETKKWTQDIKKVNAHNNYIYSLCELSKDRLVSSSGDNTIKIWSITQNDLNLLSTLSNHTNHVRKVIPLTHNRFSSCSNDKTVKIWNSEYPYEVITSLPHDNDVLDLLKLKQKEILISSTSSTSIDFWDRTIIRNYIQLKDIMHIVMVKK